MISIDNLSQNVHFFFIWKLIYNKAIYDLNIVPGIMYMCDIRQYVHPIYVC